MFRFRANGGPASSAIYARALGLLALVEDLLHPIEKAVVL